MVCYLQFGCQKSVSIQDSTAEYDLLQEVLKSIMSIASRRCSKAVISAFCSVWSLRLLQPSPSSTQSLSVIWITDKTAHHGGETVVARCYRRLANNSRPKISTKCLRKRMQMNSVWSPDLGRVHSRSVSQGHKQAIATRVTIIVLIAGRPRIVLHEPNDESLHRPH